MLHDLLYSDQGEYGYLFPYRDKVPNIRKHIFTDLKQSKEPLDQAIVGKMINLDYIGWTAKAILGLDLFPIQIAILQMMWNTPFPMLIACRGGSKSFMLAVYAVLRALLDPGTKVVIVGAGLRQARLVFNYIDTIWNSSPVLRNIVGGGKKSGPRQNVDLCYFRVGDSIIYALPMGDGCVSPYTTTTYENCFGTIADDQPADQTTNNTIERDRKIWGNGEFRLSDESYCNGKSQTKRARTHHGFEIEGTHNHKLKIVRNGGIVWSRMDQMRVGDRILLDRSARWHNGDSGVTDEEAYALGLLTGDGCFIGQNGYRLGFATEDRELADAIQVVGGFKQSADVVHWNMYGKKKIDDLITKFGIGFDHLKTKDKRFPSTILKSPRDVTSAFISGLFDTDGSVQVTTERGGTQIGVTFYNTSKELVRQLQYILLHYGIVAHVKSRKRKDEWEECYELSITGRDVLIFATEIGFRLKRKQDVLLAGIDKKKRWMDQNDNIPDILDDMVDIAENYRAARNTGNCTSVCAARLRIKKSASRPLVDNFLRVYGHIDDPRIDTIRCLADPNIYYDEIVSIEDDECVTFDVHVPDGHEYCANGFHSHNTKIRGFRANVVIADEFASIPEDVFDVVVRGFAATAKTPVEEAKKAAFDRQLAKMDLPKDIKTELTTDDGRMHGNQIVYSGTAYYAFNHFAKKHDMWQDIIRSKGDQDRVSQIFGGENLIPDGFNHRDYAIIRIPHTHLPDGLLDKRQLAHAKATLPRNIYLMEYGACQLPGSLVDTLDGVKRIEDIVVGDVVFTHKGRWKRVSARKYRYYNGVISKFNCGLNDAVSVTIDHPIYTNNGFVSVRDLHPRDRVKLVGDKLKDGFSIDLTDYCRDYCLANYDGDEFIYPRWGSDKSSRQVTRYRTKNNIPRYIPVNYCLGMILGFYAGDGDINSKLTQVNITFNRKQRQYVNQFIDAVKSVFGVDCTITNREYENVTRVHINSKIVCQLLNALIGRGAKDKRIRCSNILTESGAMGLISGYWYADGHLGTNDYHAASISISLVSDIKRLLLSLGCYSYIRRRPPKRTYFAKEDRYFDGLESWLLKIKGGYKHIFESIIAGNLVEPCREVWVDIENYREEHYEGYVYNLEVEDDHSYMGNGCIHHNCFVKDSDGFFSRSLIEGCTVGPNKPIETPDGPVTFTPLMRGQSKRKYVIGIDPAAERDNLTIVVLEIWPNHYRVVYCWSVNKKEFSKRKKNGLVTDDDYYAYCCSKIRDVTKIFNPVRIEMDSQGGGYAVSEMLRNKKLMNLDDGDFPIYEVIDPDEPKETDGEVDGRHILHLVQQSNEFNQKANVVLHKSFETRTLLFPAFDSVKMYGAIEAEKAAGIIFDTFEDNVFNIEELKNELCTIHMSETATGKERFDTPQVVQPGAVEGRTRKGRLRKDRYTALLLVHKHVYDTEVTPTNDIDYEDVPGNIVKRSNAPKDEPMYRGSGVGRMRNANDARSGGIFKAVKRGKRI